MVTLLAEEAATYARHRDELLGTDSGKFVLIKEKEVIGVFNAQLDAIRVGYERLGNVPFLVKQIVQVEVPQDFTSNLLGV